MNFSPKYTLAPGVALTTNTSPLPRATTDSLEVWPGPALSAELSLGARLGETTSRLVRSRTTGVTTATVADERFGASGAASGATTAPVAWAGLGSVPTGTSLDATGWTTAFPFGDASR